MKISRQTTQAISTDTDTLSDTDSLYTPENDGQKSKPYTLHQSLPSSSSSSSQLLKDDAQKITSVMEPVPTISKRNTRKKWTSEMNEFILRTYLYLTMMETDTEGYLQPLHMKFIEPFPDMQNKYLSVDRLEIIKNDLQKQHNDIQANDYSMLQISISNNEETDTESLHLNAENHTENENENLHYREKIIAIDEMFAKALEFYANTKLKGNLYQSRGHQKN
ncbi:unnamed protein product [Parnassius mnemosyne]|uniref:Uncharacterized protein n=1 Tax=Parnassius mnemosyne TaxID=213953 RepID=A0AAV1LIC1_9NEOP